MRCTATLSSDPELMTIDDASQGKVRKGNCRLTYCKRRPLNTPVALATMAAALHAGGSGGIPAGACVLTAHLGAREIVQALLHGVVVCLGHEQRRRVLLWLWLLLCQRSLLGRWRGLGGRQARMLRLQQRVYRCRGQCLQGKVPG